MDRYLISVCGPNGAGKSTLIKTLFASLNLPVVDPDQFSSQGLSEISAGKIAVRQIREYLAYGVSFIKESTLSSHFDIKTVIAAQAAGYRNILVYLALPSPAASRQRVARRVMAGGHAIPDAAIFRRFDKSLANLEFLKDKVDECYIVRDMRQSYSAIEKIVRLMEGGKGAS